MIARNYAMESGDFMVKLYNLILAIALIILPETVFGEDSASIGTKGEGAKADQGIETEHIFGFTEGADIGEQGDKEIENTFTGRFARRGSYAALLNETAFRYGVTDDFRASIGTILGYHGIHGVPGLDDIERYSFSGLETEFRWQPIHRTNEQPFNLTFSFEPQWARIDDISGAGTESYSLPLGVLADVALLPDKLYAGINLFYTPAFSRSGGPWQISQPLEISLALAGALNHDVFIGAEVRHLNGNNAGLFTGHALYVGLTLYFDLPFQSAFKVAWSAQIPDAGARGLDLENYERHQLRVLFVKNF